MKLPVLFEVELKTLHRCLIKRIAFLIFKILCQIDKDVVLAICRPHTTAKVLKAQQNIWQIRILIKNGSCQLSLIVSSSAVV